MKINGMKDEYLLRLIKKRVIEYHYEPRLKKIIDNFLALGEINYQGVAGHAEHVAILAKRVARRIDLDERIAFAAGLLHDVGKLTYRAELFDGRDIDMAEFEGVKRHPAIGYRWLQEIDIEIALIIGTHHDVYDGGYGISESEIPGHVSFGTRERVYKLALVISVCDHIDASLVRSTVAKNGSGRCLWKKYMNHSFLVAVAVEEAELLYEQRIA